MSKTSREYHDIPPLSITIGYTDADGKYEAVDYDVTDLDEMDMDAKIEAETQARVVDEVEAEWTIAGHEGFPDVWGEAKSRGDDFMFSHLFEVRELIEDHGYEAVEAGAGLGLGVGDIDGGHSVYDSYDDYGRQLYEDMKGSEAYQEVMAYFDFAQYGEDSAMDSGTLGEDGRLYVFHS